MFLYKPVLSTHFHDGFGVLTDPALRAKAKYQRFAVLPLYHRAVLIPRRRARVAKPTPRRHAIAPPRRRHT